MNIMLFRFELGPSTNLTADLWIFFALSMMLKMAPKMIWAKEPLYPSQAFHDIILNHVILLNEQQQKNKASGLIEIAKQLAIWYLIPS